MRRLLLSVLTGLTLLMLLVMTPAVAQAADFPFTTIRSNASVVPSRCIGPFNGGTADGTSIVLMDCSQLWRGFAPVSLPDNSIRHFSGKCLSLANTQNPTPLGTRLVLRSCVRLAEGDQQWTFHALTPGAPDGVWLLRQRFGSWCVGPLNDSTANGTQLVTQNCAFGPTQQWLLEGPPNRFGFSYDDGTTP